MNYHETILVIEGDPNDQILLVDAFRANGLLNTIHLVSSGSEAKAYLMGEGKYGDRTKFAFPTFIMTGLKMANGDGFSVLKHLKSNPDWAVIPTVVFSGSAAPDDINKSYLLGASCYHQKPASHRELQHQVKKLHDYWMTCKIPVVAMTGSQVQTHGGTQQRAPE